MSNQFANVPLEWVGPVKITGPEIDVETKLPLATYETPVFATVNRGARVATVAGGIKAVVIDERMTRSVLFEAPDAIVAFQCLEKIKAELPTFGKTVETTSRFAKLIDMHSQIAGNLLFLRLEYTTGDASGHNMVTQASEAVMNHILQLCPELNYESLSGNFCSDKKATAVNGILGRGKYVVAEVTIPEKLVRKYLKSTPEKIVQLNIRKNLIGTMLAGGCRSANAHFANMLLAFYLATGQDAANIVEGSQGITQTEVRAGDLWFSVTLPNLIVGTVGNGKGLPFVEEVLAKLGCRESREPGANARRLALICAAAVLCGELSLLAALTNPGELMTAHRKLERA
ncbi:MAG: hydroxymethylglutaryl-CoA reductase [Kiritimatiellales bacterium]